MSAAFMSIDQILDAVRHLPEPQREKLVREIASLPKPKRAHAAAQQLRSRFRLDGQQGRRMRDLLARGNTGDLTADEKRELDQLVGMFEKNTLALAEAIVREVEADSFAAAESRSAT